MHIISDEWSCFCFGQTKGTSSFGKRHNKTHTLCRRCGGRCYHIQKKKCARCGYPSPRMRKCEYSMGVVWCAFMPLGTYRRHLCRTASRKTTSWSSTTVKLILRFTLACLMVRGGQHLSESEKLVQMAAHACKLQPEHTGTSLNALDSCKQM